MRSTIAVLTDAGVANPSLSEGAKPGQRRRASRRGRLRTLSRRGSGVRIPEPAPIPHPYHAEFRQLLRNKGEF